MSRKGGYKIIDLKGLDFSEDMVIKGIHESIEDNYGKPLLFSGIVIDGVEKDDVFANAVVNGDGYDIKLYGNFYHINNLDVVEKENATHIFTLQDTKQSYKLDKVLKDGFYQIEIFTENYSNYSTYILLRKEEGCLTPFTNIEDENGSLSNCMLNMYIMSNSTIIDVYTTNEDALRVADDNRLIVTRIL